MGLPVFKDCCCLELKWGALIVAIVDILFAFAGFGAFTDYTGIADTMWLVCMVVAIAHLIACVLVIISVFKPNKKLVIAYLITGIIRVIIDLIFVIVICIDYRLRDGILTAVILIIIGIALAIYFWLVIYSWFRKLGGRTPAD